MKSASQAVDRESQRFKDQPSVSQLTRGSKIAPAEREREKRGQEGDDADQPEWSSPSGGILRPAAGALVAHSSFETLSLSTGMTLPWSFRCTAIQLSATARVGEVLEGWVDGDGNWTDNRVSFAIGCIKADMQRFEFRVPD